MDGKTKSVPFIKTITLEFSDYENAWSGKTDKAVLVTSKILKQAREFMSAKAPNYSRLTMPGDWIVEKDRHGKKMYELLDSAMFRAFHPQK
jgi:hypothetical protein